MENFKNWFLWEFLKSGIFIAFLILFGFFITIAFLSERKKNNADIQIMREEVLYIRPVGFEEKQLCDTIIKK